VVQKVVGRVVSGEQSSQGVAAEQWQRAGQSLAGLPYAAALWAQVRCCTGHPAHTFVPAFTLEL